MAERPFRVLPRVTEQNEHFWLGGAQEELRILRCRHDGYWIHPPAPICPKCLRKDIEPQVLSGDAVVHTFTVNEQPWIPTLDPPYVIAIVERAESIGGRAVVDLQRRGTTALVISIPKTLPA